MQILLAEHAGFCFGVRRAVETAERLKHLQTPVFTLGELIHNPAVVNALKNDGVLPVSKSDIPNLPNNSTLIIRSHGAPPAVFEACNAHGVAVEDATCPFVARIHNIVRAAREEGRMVFVAGRREHPEVEGICGWANGCATVLSSAKDVAALPESLPPATLVAQTTLLDEQMHEIARALALRCKDLVVHNTICDTTKERQEEAAKLAKTCTTMIVVGGAHSANTGKLFEVCQKSCKRTVFVENPAQLLLEKIHTDDIIGIVAGASTPQWMIREVVTVMNELEKTTVESTEVEATQAEESAAQAETVDTPVAAEEAPVVQEEAPVAQEAPVVHAEAPAVEEAPAAEEAPEEAAPAAEIAPAAEEVAPAQEAATEAAAPVEEAAPAQEAAAEEDDSIKEDASFAEAFEKTMVRIRNGQIITGSIVQIVDGEVSVNIGYKSDGFIPKNEFSSDPDVNPADVVKVGDAIEVEVLKVNDGEGNVLLSRKSVEGKKLWEELVQEAEEPDKVFEAVGKDVVKGGLIASINGVRAFVPASHVSTKYVENLSDFVGQPMRLAVIEVDKARKRIVASQKNVLLKDQEAEKKKKWAELEAGAKMEGTVRRLTDFGAFVDIGGIDGLVHVTDIAWGRVKHPSDILKIGQQIEVLVLNVDTEKERISLGYKQLQPKPWTMAGEKYPVGSVVEGKVVRIVPFGAFVALEPTIDGLIHISQVSVKRIAKVEDEINVGDTVRCKVLDVNPEAKRISLSRKEVILEENPEIA
ncbi:bifunctional 4-hydroxy-3-methylbut-2-enyl diphosphate reductase/30S ribosomal protein S1, partial [Christensenellaceae bacterium OttesenSCG-928-L17]|nr:bifunctional 4-hydroxy-3-methylbut-2-enyl diphosphate reductase/30S ribosomal protein S1 [Christensenellaceae bacterium OttesenSCG-928-L17]